MNSNPIGPIAALGVMGLALAIALVTGGGPSSGSSADVAWATRIEQGADHVDARTLATLLAADPPGAVVIDVRPTAEFAGYHLPGAHNLDLPRLLGDEGRALLASAGDRMVVLCSNGMTHPAQAWVELTRRGHANVRVLEDGLTGFVRDVLMPPSLRPGMDEARAAALAAGYAADRARFLPATSPEATTPTPAVDRLATDPPTLTAPTVVSTAWVAARLDQLVVVDTRDSADDFATGHVPGAIHVPTKTLRGMRGDLPEELLPPDQIAAKLGALGIAADATIVAYGGDRLQDPTHFALAAIRVGHRRIAVVEGGFPAWTAEGRVVATTVTTRTPVEYDVRPSDDPVIAQIDEVARASESGAPLIVDVRPTDAFRGDVSTEARPGHIPRSRNRPYSNDVDKSAAGVYWRPAAALRAEYAALGVTPDRPVIVSCRTGHQASQTWFLLRWVFGMPDVRWYDGSWKEWALHAELPAATGGDNPQ